MAKLMTKKNIKITIGVVILVVLIAIICAIVCNKDVIAEEFGRKRPTVPKHYRRKHSENIPPRPYTPTPMLQ
jgi:hypothetical protein